jgi:ABC-type Fe3+/spermidine/putrescine transport system ATPase subunit
MDGGSGGREQAMVDDEAPGHQADPIVELQGIEKTYGQLAAVSRLDLTVGRGEFLAILGPSGCGKTTLLKMIGGFIAPTRGAIKIGGHDVTHLGPERRPTNMVFQSYGLFPHMTVAQNVAYGPRLSRAPPAEVAARVAEVIKLVSLTGLETRPVTSLSGGQQQRVALARALIMRPQVLLLDEPLAALDLKLRKRMQEELRQIHRSVGGTFVFVTHDQEEAMGLASRIVVMERGRVVQDGSPEEIYARPATRFVSDFIGDANMLAGSREQGIVRINSSLCFHDEGPDGPVVLVVRPEAVGISVGGDPPPAGRDLAMSGTVEDVVFLGAFTKYAVDVEGGRRLQVSSSDEQLRQRIAVGQPVTVHWARRSQRLIVDD